MREVGGSLGLTQEKVKIVGLYKVNISISLNTLMPIVLN